MSAVKKMQAQQWIKPRCRALGKTLAGLGKAMGGLHSSRMTEIMAGTRRVQPEEARSMAEYLELAPEEVYARLYGMLPSPIDVRDARPAITGHASTHLRVHAARDLGSGIVEISPDTLGPVLFTGTAVPRPFNCYVTTDHMIPVYEPGDDLEIDPSLPVVPNSDVLLVAGNSGEQVRAALRRLVDKDDKYWHVKQWNPEKTEKFDRKVWRPLRVAAVRRRG